MPHVPLCGSVNAIAATSSMFRCDTLLDQKEGRCAASADTRNRPSMDSPEPQNTTFTTQCSGDVLILKRRTTRAMEEGVSLYVIDGDMEKKGRMDSSASLKTWEKGPQISILSREKT